MGTIAALIVLGSMGATPTWSVAVTRRVGVSADSGMELAEMLSVELGNLGEKIPGTRVSPHALAATLLAANNPDTASCAGATDCAAVIARQGGVDFLFAIQMVKVGQNIILDATLVRAPDGAAVATATKATPFKKPVKAIGELATDLAAKAGAMHEPLPKPPEVASPPPPPVAGSTETAEGPGPVKVSSASPEAGTSTRAEPAEQPSMSVGRYVALGLGVAAVGVGAAGGYFGFSAMSQANNLSDKDPNLSRAQSQVMSTAQTADAAYGIAAAVAISAIVVWIVARPSSPATVTPASGADASLVRWDF